VKGVGVDGRRPQQPVGRRLGDLLVSEGLITPEQLARALVEQRGTPEKLGSILIRLGLIQEDQLTGFLSRQYGIPSIALSQLEVERDVLDFVPARIARKYEVLPVRRTGNTLTLAMADPTNVFAIDDVAFMTNLQVFPVVAPQSALRQAIERSYDVQAATLSDIIAEIDGEIGPVEVIEGEERDAVLDVFELKESADQAPVVRLVNLLLVDAIVRGASDIHLEPYEKVLRVRFRIDGMLHEVMTPPRRLEPAIVSRVKIMANLDIAERRLPQDGRIKLRYNGRQIDFRISTVPTIHGEKTVMRLLDKEGLKLDLGDLGFDPWSLETFINAIHNPYGMILLTGPTGSGKTTTLYSAIQAINSPDINIVTAEDPVEYNLTGINQLQVHEGIGRTFAGALRSFLRQDPDVILVGETRDLETAQIAVRAALTGHRVFTTLHTNDAPSAVARLLDMGIPPFLVSSSLQVVVAQRLARKICSDCTQPFQMREDALTPYGHVVQGIGTFTTYGGKGCPLCNFTGMRGRVALYEVMAVTPEIRELILREASTAELREVASSQGMKTLRQAGLLKLIEGVTTIEEVLRVTLA
jgi:type IV pilus assembly protein PilB